MTVETAEKWIRCRDPKEWVCDECGACGDPECCPGSGKMWHYGDHAICKVCIDPDVLPVDMIKRWGPILD